MINEDKFAEDLTDMFIAYQWRLDNPMPSPRDTKEEMILKYQTDSLFHAKVNALVGGVMHTLYRIQNQHLTPPTEGE